MLTPRQRISRARILLLQNNPFFGSIAMKLIPRELSKEDVEKYGIKTIAVDIYGNMPYNPEFIKKLSDEELQGVLCHEIMHICLKHLERLGTRRPKVWNLATDSAINDFLRKNKNFRLPPNNVWFSKMSGKSAEEIYDWLIKNWKEGQGMNSFDTHIYTVSNSQSASGKQKQQKGSPQNSPFYKQGQQKIDPTRAVREAYNFARQQGNVPAGIERLFKNILEPKMNWKDILRKYIVSVIPHDFTYTYPSKKSYSTGFYMPRVVREYIDIIVAVDSSGSIRDEEYAEFLSEIFFLSKQFENLRMTVIVCDCQIQEIVEVTGTFDPYSIKGRGYGGTSSIPVYNWIKENKNDNIKLLVYFTDGWIDIPREEKRFHTLWIITSEGTDDTVKEMPNATVIKIPKKD